MAQEEIREARDAAELANRSKSAFLANMSHEIRTPLGAILGYADLLRDRTLESREKQQFVETILRNGKALTRIIDDILDLAKVESGKLEIEESEFSLFSLIDEVKDMFRESARARGIYLRGNFAPNTPDAIVSDLTRLRQILINLVGNAIKFTEQGGVTIELSAGECVDSLRRIKIAIKDTGIGLSEEQKLKLFQPFVQADNTTSRKFGGSGLGLALSRRLANVLKGDIDVEHYELGAGCTFCISFLAGEAKPLGLHTKKSVHGDSSLNPQLTILKGVRVLLAEDSHDNQDLIERMLHKYGASVAVAGNGEEALSMTAESSYDVVLMDVQMPVMDGYQAVREMRHNGFSKPILALTAHAMSEERAKTYAAGFNCHITKPLNEFELIEAIRSQIANVPKEIPSNLH